MTRLFFVFTFLICFVSATKAQVSIIAGINHADIKSSAEFGNARSSPNYAWQFGLSDQIFITKATFLYTGFLYESRNSDQSYSFCCFESNERTLQPQFLTTSLGTGHRFLLDKSKWIDISIGTYLSYGAGGNATGVSETGDIIIPIPYYYNREIKFSKDKDLTKDMARWNWGLQSAIAIGFKKISFKLNYELGINNLMPGNPPDFKLKYRTTAFQIAYKLIK